MEFENDMGSYQSGVVSLHLFPSLQVLRAGHRWWLRIRSYQDIAISGVGSGE